MRLEKTDKARAELQGGTRQLGQRERSLLILADGRKTAQDIDYLFNGEAQTLARSLMQEGYLVGIDLSGPASAATPPAPEPVRLVAATGADPFEGKRSLATTRMFLFDICERMFVRRLPEQADAFREALRNAKDRESMLVVSRDMISLIEELAGPERADSISERIAQILPPEH
jgi:hypothetical protein